jgi:hypothetical protein
LFIYTLIADKVAYYFCKYEKITTEIKFWHQYKFDYAMIYCSWNIAKVGVNHHADKVVFIRKLGDIYDMVDSMIIISEYYVFDKWFFT